MKTYLTTSGRKHGFGAILFMVLIMVGVSLLILSASMRRTGTVANLNDRNNQFSINQNAAEAAVEKAVARMSYDFQNFGLGSMNANLPVYRSQIPNANENAFWSNFTFSDGQGGSNSTYVAKVADYSGPLPSQYPGRTCLSSPVYRILSNVRAPSSRNPDITGTVQVDVLAALVPITQWAIFYNGLLEFSSCATMTVNGAVHANGDVYTGSDSQHTINGTVTTTGKQTAPANNGHNSSWTYKGVLNGTPKKSENVPVISLAIGTNMSNVHSIIDMPPPGVSATNLAEKARLINLAQVVLLVSNTTVTARIQVAPSAGEVPGSDGTAIIIGPTLKTDLAGMATNFPFLTVTNTFVDQRESPTNVRKVNVADIDLAKYKLWIANDTRVTGKTTRPTILFVANNVTPSPTVLPAVRLKNGVNLPSNGGLGFTVATPNPLYVLGHYNCPNSSALGTTDTSATVPAALMSDALTILSESWLDSQSSSAHTVRNAKNTTVNAAILTGVIPSTGTKNTEFSGGVHNLTRLLEDWTESPKKTLTLNTSILSLYRSQVATNQFRNPSGFGTPNPYYEPPTRNFSYDINFKDYNKTPPGIPTALVLIRKDWAMPPPNKVDFYASP